MLGPGPTSTFVQLQHRKTVLRWGEFIACSLPGEHAAEACYSALGHGYAYFLTCASIPEERSRAVRWSIAAQ